MNSITVTVAGPAGSGKLETPVRPVRCWYCGQQMHYSGHVAHEPEVRLTLDTGDTEEILHLHTRCWNDWQQRRRGDDERDRHADALRCALEALDYCIEDSAELLNERTVQCGSFRKDRLAAMAATLERHRAVAERLREMLRA